MPEIDGHKKTDLTPEDQNVYATDDTPEAEEMLAAEEEHVTGISEADSDSDGKGTLPDAEVPAPPPYLAQEIKARLRYEDPRLKRRVHRRIIGSPHFLAFCAVILAGVVVTLGVIIHMNNAEPREDYWAPAIVVSAGHAVILLADSDDPMREISTDELNERLRRELYSDTRGGIGDQSTIARAEASDETGPSKRPAEGR